MRGIAAVAGGAAQLLCSLCLLRGGGAPRRPLSLRPRFAHTLDDAASLDPHLLDHHRTWSALSAPAMDGSWTARVAREARGALKGNAVKQPTYKCITICLQYAISNHVDKQVGRRLPDRLGERGPAALLRRHGLVTWLLTSRTWLLLLLIRVTARIPDARLGKADAGRVGGHP